MYASVTSTFVVHKVRHCGLYLDAIGEEKSHRSYGAHLSATKRQTVSVDDGCDVLEIEE